MAKVNSTEEAPHTQVWEEGSNGAVWRAGALADMVHLPTDGHAQSKPQIQARAKLIAAAPDMARALRSLVEYASQWESWNTGKPAAIETAEAALKKAGVLP